MSRSSAKPFGVPRQSSPLKMTSKRTCCHVVSLSGQTSATASSTIASERTISRRSASGITGARPLARSAFSSLTTPATSTSQCSRARRRMLRWPMWNRSNTPGTYPTRCAFCSSLMTPQSRANPTCRAGAGRVNSPRATRPAQLEVPLGQREEHETRHRGREQRVPTDQAVPPREREEQQAHQPVVGRHDRERVERRGAALAREEVLALAAQGPAQLVGEDHREEHDRLDE